MNGAPKADRYRSFRGIDCIGNSLRVAEAVMGHVRGDEDPNPFWRSFARQLAAAGDPERHTADVLRLVCANISYIEELLEARGDAEALALVHRLEEDCC